MNNKLVSIDLAKQSFQVCVYTKSLDAHRN